MDQQCDHYDRLLELLADVETVPAPRGEYPPTVYAIPRYLWEDVREALTKARR